jgi:aminobenzoyl-glutamate utilization protein B
VPQKDDEIWQYVDAKKDTFIGLSDRVWGMPELCFAEERSVAEHIRALEAEGFGVKREVAGMPTAVIGKRVVGVRWSRSWASTTRSPA